MNQHKQTKFEQHFVDSKTFLLTPGAPDLLCKYLITEDVVKVLKILFGEYSNENEELSLDAWASNNQDELSLWLDVRKLSTQQKLELGFDLNVDE